MKQTLKNIMSYGLKASLSFLLIFYLIGNSVSILDYENLKISYQILLMAVFLYIGHIFIATLRWMILLSVQGIELSFRTVFVLIMKCYFFSLFVPGGAAISDLIKIKLLNKNLRKGERLEGVLSIFMDRLIGVTSLFMCSLLMFFLYESNYNFAYNAILLYVFLGAFGCIVAFSFIALLPWITKMGLWRRFSFFAKKKKLYFVDRVVQTAFVYRRHLTEIIFCFIVTCLFIHLLQGFVFFLLAKSIGLESSLVDSMTACVVGNAVGIIPCTVSGIGARDYIMVELLQSPSENSIIAVLLFTLIMILTYSLGIFFFFIREQKVVN